MVHEEYHAGEHVNGEDDIQDATDSQKGLATSTQITKLDGMAEGATDYDNADAVVAMGVKGDENTLNHDKYLDAAAVSAVEANGLDLESGKNMKVVSALTSDNTWSGMTAVLTAGENLAINELGYIKSDGKVWKAKADAAATMPCVVIATGTINADNAGVFLMLGFMRDDDWDWTPGGSIYVSEATGGALTQSAPDGAGEQVQILGVALTADIIMFKPDLTLVEIS